MCTSYKYQIQFIKSSLNPMVHFLYSGFRPRGHYLGEVGLNPEDWKIYFWQYCFLPKILFWSNFHTVPATATVLYLRSKTKFSYHLKDFPTFWVNFGRFSNNLGQFWRIFQYLWSILGNFGKNSHSLCLDFDKRLCSK